MAHSIGNLTFRFWRGTSPQLVQQQITSHTRPGADDVGKIKNGIYGQPFQSTLVEHFSSFAAGEVFIPNYFNLVDSLGPVAVVYNNINYQAVHGHLYYVDACQIVSHKAHPRLMGPNYDYIGGSEMIVQFTLTPFKA